MCTLILDRRTEPTLHSNRDEIRSRPARPPFYWDGPHEIYAPQDLVGLGTWVGANSYGTVVAVTNRFRAENIVTKRSRGGLVVGALEQQSASDVRSWLASQDLNQFNPFHLLYFDASDAFITYPRNGRWVTDVIDSDLFVVCEQSFGAGDSERETWLLGELERGKTPETLLRVSRPDAPVTRPQIDLPELNYGTRSRATARLFPDRVEFIYEDDLSRCEASFPSNSENARLNAR